MIDRVASTDATVLILGESGVGKELVARAVHQESPRRGPAFIKVNCAALPMDLLESELFGYERGAFTGAHRHKPGKFELANGGTIFLDEIGEMPLPLQAKLLHVLQDHEFSRLGRRQDVRVDVRVIAATNKNLASLVDHNRFREDLYYRLNVVEIYVPPLRDRREEIAILIEHFQDRYSRRYLRPRHVISPTTMEFLQAYTWPGNVRELENTVKRLVLMGTEDWLVQELRARWEISGPDSSSAPAGEIPSSGTLILLRALSAARPKGSPPPLPVTAVTVPAIQPTFPEDGPSLKEIALEAALQAERGVLKQVLDRVHWNRREAARLLKVSYRTLRRKINECGLED
jgi:transcriptional regulator with PAS, ATPase and Fis domain